MTTTTPSTLALTAGGPLAQANAARLAEGYAAFGRGDIATLGEVFHPDVVWHVRRLGQLSGDHAGWPAVLDFFARTGALTQGTFRVEPLEILANEAGAAAVVRSSGRRGERTLDDRQVHHFHMRDGRVVEVWQHPGDALATNEFWA